MSDGVQVVMRIDPIKPPACFETASDVIEWLRSECVIAPNRKKRYAGWTRWGPDERWADVVGDINDAPFLHLLHNGVDVATERMFHGAGSEPPECPAVIFNNWFRLSDAFVDQLSARPGGRCRRLIYKF